jgi:hypothetical protein
MNLSTQTLFSDRTGPIAVTARADRRSAQRSSHAALTHLLFDLRIPVLAAERSLHAPGALTLPAFRSRRRPVNASRSGHGLSEMPGHTAPTGRRRQRRSEHHPATRNGATSTR